MNDVKQLKLLPLKPDSLESGLCHSCPHNVESMCNTGKPCGQVMACRSQFRAICFGRFPNGRVRKAPLKRSRPLKREFPKPMVWQKNYAKMEDLGNGIGCVWIGLISDSKQSTVRRWVKQGKMCAYYIDGINMRGKPALFVKREALDLMFGDKWEG